MSIKEKRKEKRNNENLIKTSKKQQIRLNILLRGTILSEQTMRVPAFMGASKNWRCAIEGQLCKNFAENF